MKFGLFLDKTKVNSYFCENGKSFNYFTKQPQSRIHSISNEFQLGFWNYPVLFDGTLLNLNEFEKLPDEEFDCIFLSLELPNSKFTIDDIKNKYKCKIFGIFKEVHDVDEKTQVDTFLKSDALITGVNNQVNMLKSQYGKNVYYIPQAVNIDYLRKNYYVQDKTDDVFCYVMPDLRSIVSLYFAKTLGDTCNIKIKYNEPKNSYMNIGDFLKYFNSLKFHINMDTYSLSVGQQTCMCAALGLVNFGGNNDATYNLYPETYGLDFNKCFKFYKLMSIESHRLEYEQIVFNRLNQIYHPDVVKNKILNLL